MVIEPGVEHAFAESGLDPEQGCFTACTCGWRSSWWPTPREAADDLEAHWGGERHWRPETEAD